MNKLLKTLMVLSSLTILASCGGNSSSSSSSKSSSASTTTETVPTSESSKTSEESTTDPASETKPSETSSEEPPVESSDSAPVESSEQPPVESSESKPVETSEEPPVESSESTKESTSSSIEKTPLEIFNEFFAASKPTKIVMNQVYRNSKIGADLTQKASLEIEYGSTIKTKFTYEYQILNPIGAEEPIGTKSGTIYSSGRDVYQTVNDGVELVEEADVTFLLATLNLNNPSFFSEYEADVDYLMAKVKDNNVKDVLGNEFDITGLSFEIDLVDERLDYLQAKYKTDIEASVACTCRYTYENITVDIPA